MGLEQSQSAATGGISRKGGSASARCIQGVEAARELFWQNVIREMLTSLSAVCAARGVGPPPDGQPDLLDGRLAIVTTRGQRIPIGFVMPLFACGIPGTAFDRALSAAVECTVFQIRTPGGEVFTLPLHEIRMFHSITEDLQERLKDASKTMDKDGADQPFGFAAYTSLARTQLPQETDEVSAGQGPEPAD